MERKVNKMNDEYRFWLHDLTHNWCFECSNGKNYHSLLNLLDSIPFISVMDADMNRIEDARDFRLRFADAYDYSYREVDLYLDSSPSVLEVMTALACRCEDHIMSDPDLGDRAGIWFFEMIKSLGLEPFDNAKFDPAKVKRIIEKFVNRDYAPNGEGGLFTVNLSGYDLRDMNIWDQMNWWVSFYRE